MLVWAIALSHATLAANSTMVAVALPSIRQDFDVSLGVATWLIVGFLVAFAVIQPLGGKLGDRLGRGRVLMWGLGVAMLFSALSIFAWNAWALLALRVLQAAGMAMIIPNGMALIRDTFPMERRGRAFGLVAITSVIGASLAPLIAGPIVDLSWRGIPLAVGAALIVCTGMAVLALPRGRHTSAAPEPIDLLGVVLLAAAVLCLATFATLLHQETPWPALLFLASGAVLATAFFAWEGHAPSPVIGLSLYRIRSYAMASLAMHGIQLTMYSIVLSTPLFLEEVRGLSAKQSGLMLAVMSMGSAISAPFGGRLADRFGRRNPVLGGIVLLLLGVGVIAGFGLEGPVWTYGLGLVLLGAGFGLQAAGINTSVVESCPREVAATAAGTAQMTRHLGSVVGSSIVAAVLGAGAIAAGEVRLVLIITGSLALLSMGAAYRIHHWPQRDG